MSYYFRHFLVFLLTSSRKQVYVSSFLVCIWEEKSLSCDTRWYKRVLFLSLYLFKNVIASASFFFSFFLVKWFWSGWLSKAVLVSEHTENRSSRIQTRGNAFGLNFFFLEIITQLVLSSSSLLMLSLLVLLSKIEFNIFTSSPVPHQKIFFFLCGFYHSAPSVLKNMPGEPFTTKSPGALC